jgi:Uncharacterized protein conserved in bacteria (DUF2330)
MLRRVLLAGPAAALVLALGAGPALACGALVSPNGTVQLVRTTTLAAYHGGVEHYITGFKFAGGGAEFGSIVPLPAVPSRIIRGGDWTLQRLEREVQPPVEASFDAAGAPAPRAAVRVIMVKNIDSLHLTVITGGGFAVGRWATQHGFLLPPDAPAVLDFYANRSPVFMAVEFDAKKAAARGENLGDAIPIDLVIPTNRPWVPLRILGLGAKPSQAITADVFLLTDDRPNMLPVPAGSGARGVVAPGLRLERSTAASDLLLSDLRSDKRMQWLPKHGMWLSFLTLNTPASKLTYDLALNVRGGSPSPVDAGLSTRETPVRSAGPGALWILVVGVLLLAVLFAVGARERRGSRIAI